MIGPGATRKQHVQPGWACAGSIMLNADQVREIAEPYIRGQMKEWHCSAVEGTVEVESVEVDFKAIRAERLSYLVQAVATEKVCRWLTVRPKGLLSKILRRRESRVKGQAIPGHIVRFQLRIDAESGNILATDVARGKGGVIDPFFDMKCI